MTRLIFQSLILVAEDKRITKIIKTCFLFFIFVNTAFAVSIKGYQPQVKFFQLDNQQTTNPSEINFYGLCKEYQEIKFEKPLDIEFIQDKNSGRIQFRNNNQHTISSVIVEFSKPLSAIIDKVEKNIFLDKGHKRIVKFPNSFLDLYKDRIISVTGIQTPIVRCVKKFTENEIQELKAKKEQEKLSRSLKIKEAEEKEIIYNNCLADKLPRTNNRNLNDAVIKICKRTSENPSWWDRFWYSD